MDYKKKNWALLVAFIIAMVGIYFFTISKTIESKKRLSKLQQEKHEIQTISNRVLNLKKQAIYIDSILSKENISITNSFQQILLKKINTFKTTNAIDIVGVEHSIQVKDNGIKVRLYPLTVKGNFNDLLAFLNYMERQGLAEIKNYTFLKKKNYSTRKAHVVLKLYLKKIEEEV